MMDVLKQVRETIRPNLYLLHAEGCEARSEENEDEIDDSAFEYLDGCDCGLAASWKATEIINTALSGKAGET
jgi:hypothetical protein